MTKPSPLPELTVALGKEPLSSPLRIDVARLAGNLKGIALELTQRRTFQQRFQGDLESALSSGQPRRSGESGRPSSVQYQPPPSYEGAGVSEDEKGGLPPARPPPSLPPRTGGAPPSPGSADAPRLLENLSIIRETLYSGVYSFALLVGSSNLSPVREQLSPTFSSPLLRFASCSREVQSGPQGPTSPRLVSAFLRWR